MSDTPDPELSRLDAKVESWLNRDKSARLANAKDKKLPLTTLLISILIAFAAGVLADGVLLLIFHGTHVSLQIPPYSFQPPFYVTSQSGAISWPRAAMFFTPVIVSAGAAYLFLKYKVRKSRLLLGTVLSTIISVTPIIIALTILAAIGTQG